MSTKFEKEIAIAEARLQRIRARMVERAFAMLGTTSHRYRTPEQGTGDDGWYDCSGLIWRLVQDAYAEEPVDPEIPRHANEQWRSYGEPCDYAHRAPGDLVFFASRRKNDIRIIGHVGLVVADDLYIHAPGKDNTVVALGELPREQVVLPDIRPQDLVTKTPAGIKRISEPIGSGRWRVH